jgi:V-type H+-transporting ATPase subunit a
MQAPSLQQAGAAQPRHVIRLAPAPRPPPPPQVTTRLRELHHTIETGDRHREGVLQTIAFNLDAWAGQVRREKAIYHTLNKLSMDASKRVR